MVNKKIYLSMCNKNSCPGPVHVVEPGDTLYGIARKHHTRVRVLLDLNPFVDIYNLQPGDEICIPTGPSVRPGGISSVRGKTGGDAGRDSEKTFHVF